MSASIGSISTGTLRTEDLLTAFADALEDLVQANGRTGKDNQAAIDLIRSARECAEDIDAGKGDFEDGADDILDDLRNSLEEYAPPYCYFGARYGDGAAFGFWPCWDSIDDAESSEDLLKVDDTSQVPNDYTGDVLHVNDHGNCAFYAAQDGKLTEIWSCV